MHQKNTFRLYRLGIKHKVKALMNSLFQGVPNKPFRSGQKLKLTSIHSLDQFVEYSRSMSQEHTRRALLEKELASQGRVFSLPGYCAVCDKETGFHVDLNFSHPGPNGRTIPNWRERMVCASCGLNNRMRAGLHIFRQVCSPAEQDRIYITEQTTQFYQILKKSYPNTQGSEYLGNEYLPGQENFLGIRNESLTSLSFQDQSFDYILCFDVLEHVPEYAEAVRECFRVLCPGGTILFSVPFRLDSWENTVRACIDSKGEVKHFLPPEYHGDPLNKQGCLCFYHFGWEMLEMFRGIGFREAACLFYWSRDLGYLGGDQFIFKALK